MKVRQTGPQAPLLPARPKDIEPSARERVSQGWTPLPREDPRRQQQTMQPLHGAQLGNAVVESMRQLAPAGVTGVDPLQLLDGVRDGRATIAIPLQPGHYKTKGVGYHVKPGTVARVQVDVKDGRVMPAVDQQGRPTGRGTKVELDPPLDLPLWVTGNGAYVQDKGRAQAAFKADLGGFFDLKLKQLDSTKLSDVVRGFGAEQPGKAMHFPKGMLRTDQVRFDAQVSMKDNVVTAGAAKIDLAPGSNVTLNGTSKRATLDGQVNIDGARLEQAGAHVKLGPGQAHVHADCSTQADGTMRLSTNVTNVNARIEQASIERARRPGDTDPDRLELGSSRITNGSFSLDATLQQQRGSAVPQLTASTMRLHGETEGALMGAKLTVKDAQDDAELKLGPGRFKGTLDVSPEGHRLDGAITGTTLDVKDLQTKNGTAKLGVHHGHFEGDLKLSSDTARGDFDLTMQAKKVDVRIDGYQGRSAKNNVDFERIEVNGAGTININSKTGTQIDGEMRVRGTVNDLAIGQQLDVTKGSTLDGRATHFHAGGERGFELTGQAALDARVEKFDVAAGGLTATGAGRLRGDARFEITKDDVSLVMTKARAEVKLDDAKVGGAGASMGLDVAKGSTATLQLEEARFGKAADGITSSVKLGKGSVIDATLDEGHATVQGRRIELEKGAQARFEFDSLQTKNGELPALKGSLSLQTGLSTGDLSGLDAGGIKVTQAGALKGRVSLEVPNVTLAPDGKVTYRDAHVSLDARIGDVRPGLKKPAPAGAHPAGVLTEAQVKAKSAAEIAGASSAGRPTGYDPLDAARRVKNGTVELEIPVEGRLGEGYWKSADFAKGTTLKLQLKVKDGQLVPSETKAQFSKSGDAALWVTAKGAYLDDDNTLRLDLGGWKDVAFPGMEKLPTDIDQLVTRLSPGGGKHADTSAIKFEQARVNIQGATFKPGKMNVPGGWIDVGPKTRLSVKGSMTDAVLSGNVELNGVDITEGGVALKGSHGTADLNIAWRHGVATTTLDRLNVDTEYAVQKRENGDYLKLAKGRVTNGRLTMEVPVDARAMTADLPTKATLDVPQFSGFVEGARLTAVMPNGKRTQLELGRARVDGEVHISPEVIEVKGTVRDADVAARGLSASGAAGAAEIDSARLVGSGRLDFSSRRGLEVEADVSSLDVRASKARAAGTSAHRSRITGAGHVEWSSTKGLALEGDLHVEADVSGEASVKRPAAVAQRQPVRRVTVQRAAVSP